MEEFLTGLKRTKMCAEFRASDIGKKVTAMGFVQKYRNLGSLLFVDLRDRTGIVQLSFVQADDKNLFEKSTSIRNEYVLAIVGEVAPRGEKNINSGLPTGEIEILVKELRIVSEAEVTPFNINDDVKASEQLRLKYRYLDLRRPSLQNRIVIKDKIMQITRQYMSQKGFLDIETPFLGKSTPEGARDYLVPSRIHDGCFYALPQSPQLYKQLLMIAGFDRYYQIARCFRDEDLRANRQPEFTQIDMEMSYVDKEEDVMKIAEGLIRNIFKGVLNVALPRKIKRLTYKTAMEKYGSDKPYTCFGLEINDITKLVKGCDFPVFKNATKKGFSVRGINAKDCSKFTRKEIDSLQEVVKEYGAKGLAYISIKEEGISSPISKFFSKEKLDEIINSLDGKVGDLLFFVADENKVVFDSLGALRIAVARKCGLINDSKFDILWITDFPLYEYSKDEKRFVAMHHPFTSPKNEHLKYFETNLAKVNAKAYDLVINGQEAGGGSIRIHSKEIQSQMFTNLGFSDEDIKEKFGYFIDAFKYGVPPHGGLAFGLDRLTMIISGTDNIKDVIAFPKVQNASCLMSDAPNIVEDVQLRDLHLTIKK